MVTPSLSRLLGPPDRTLRVPRDGAVFTRGEPAAAVFEVLAGRVRLERNPADGTPLVLGVLLAGDGLAEAALFSDTYHCDARAEVSSHLAAWDKAALLARLDAEPELARRWLERTSRQVRSLRSRLELRSIRPLSRRVVTWLRLRDEGLGAGFAEPGDDKPLRALADELGASPEALYRSLADLEADGVVRRDGRAIEYLDDAAERREPERRKPERRKS